MNENTDEEKTAGQIIALANGKEYNHKSHKDEWKNQVAKDLNEMLGRVVFQLETDGDECDRSWAIATLRVIDRVAEFEGIKTK